MIKRTGCILFVLVTSVILLITPTTASAEEFVIPRYTLTEDEMVALQKIALAEADNTTVWDMALVIQVVLNRVESDKFPNTVMEVIEQPGQFSTYPTIYNKKEPNFNSSEALRCTTSDFMLNYEALYFEITKEGSWISTHKQFLFKSHNVSYYK